MAVKWERVRSLKKEECDIRMFRLIYKFSHWLGKRSAKRGVSQKLTITDRGVENPLNLLT